MQIDRKKVASGVGAFFIVALLFSIFSRLGYWLTITEPVAWDSYYYLQEIRSIRATGSTYYHLHPLFFYLIAWPLSLVISSDPLVLGVIQSLAYLGLLFALGALAFVCKSRWLALLAVVSVGASQQLFHLINGSTCQAFSLVPLFFGVVFFMLGKVREEEDPLNLWKKVSYGLLLLSAGLHIFSATIVTLFLFIVLVDSPKREFLDYAVFGFALVILAFLSFSNPKEVFSNLTILEGEVPYFYFKRYYHKPFQVAELFCGVVVLILLTVAAFLKKNRVPLVVGFLIVTWMIILPAYVLFWEDSLHPGTLSDRLPQVALLMIGALAILLYFREESERARTFILGSLCVMASFYSIRTFSIDFEDPLIGHELPPALFSRNADKLISLLDPNAFVEAPHGVQFRVTYYLNMKSAQLRTKSAVQNGYYSIQKYEGHACPLLNSEVELQSPVRNCLGLNKDWIIVWFEPQSEDSRA